MASVSVSHMILFIASMIIAASVAGVFTTSVDELAGAIDDQGLQVSDNVRTSIDIISDSGASDQLYDANAGDNGELTLLVKNTGTTRLPVDANQIDVLVNGQFQPASDLTIELLGAGDMWSQNEVIRVTVDVALGDGDHRAMVIVNDDEEVFRFRLGGGT
jgi:flagellar protein FlaG